MSLTGLWEKEHNRRKWDKQDFREVLEVGKAKKMQCTLNNMTEFR